MPFTFIVVSRFGEGLSFVLDICSRSSLLT